MVYSTCTFAPEEDEGTVSRFLERHPDFSIEPVQQGEGFWCGQGKWVENPADGVENTVRLMPHRIKGEGHYFAVLHRAGECVLAKGREIYDHSEQTGGAVFLFL